MSRFDLSVHELRLCVVVRHYIDADKNVVSMLLLLMLLLLLLMMMIIITTALVTVPQTSLYAQYAQLYAVTFFIKARIINHDQKYSRVFTPNTFRLDISI